MNCKPSPAFVGASWVALGTGMIGYFIGLWRSDMQLNEKGYYFTTIMYGLFSVVSLQKAVRDRLENIRGDRCISWTQLVLNHSERCASDYRTLECRTIAKRKGILCLCIFARHVRGCCCTKKCKGYAGRRK